MVQLPSAFAVVEENKREGKAEEQTSGGGAWQRGLPLQRAVCREEIALWIADTGVCSGGALGLGREGKFQGAKSNTGKRMQILQEKLHGGERH